MRILFCASTAPVPPINGHRLQLIHLAGELAERHDVCFLAYRGPDQRGDAPRGVELIELDPPASGAAARAADYARSLVRREPARVTRLAGPMSRAVADLLSRRAFDVAHVSHGTLAPIAPALRQLPAVLGARDAWHLNVAADALTAPAALRPLYRLERRRVARFEASAFRPYRRIVMVSDEDARALARLDPTLPLEVVPNGVDARAFSPDGADRVERGNLLFTGAMHWSPNVVAARVLARDVLPRVRDARPEAHVSIVGRSPTDEVAALGELDGVRVTGAVPDMLPWLSAADVYVCPMTSGTGIKNKLLEALACGRPCVATTLSCQGLRVEDGRELLVADDPGSIAEAVVRLLGDDELRSRLGRAGREYVVEHHSWSAVARAFERIYGAAVADAQARA